MFKRLENFNSFFSSVSIDFTARKSISQLFRQFAGYVFHDLFAKIHKAIGAILLQSEICKTGINTSCFYALVLSIFRNLNYVLK